MQVDEQGGVVGRLGQHLQTAGKFFEALEIIFCAGEGIVDIIVAALIEARCTEGEAVCQACAEGGFHVDRVEPAIGDAAITAGLFARLDAVEFDDAAGRITAKQGPLRPTQDFDLRNVEDGIAFEDRVFIRDIIIDQRDGLGRVQIEIRVADAADIKAREAAAKGAFGDNAWDARREETDVGTACGDIGQLVTGQRGDGNRHVLNVLRNPLRRHFNLVEPEFFGVTVYCLCAGASKAKG